MRYSSISTISNNICTQLLFLKIKKKRELIENFVPFLVENLGIKVMRLLVLWKCRLWSCSIITAFTGRLEQLRHAWCVEKLLYYCITLRPAIDNKDYKIEYGAKTLEIERLF